MDDVNKRYRDRVKKDEKQECLKKNEETFKQKSHYIKTSV